MLKVNQNVSFIYTDVVALAQRAHLGSACYALLTRGQFSTGHYTTNSKNTTYFWFSGDNNPSCILFFKYNKVCLHGTGVHIFLLYASFH